MSSLKQSKAIVIILSGPSGSGKTSVAKILLQKLPKLGFSISATSRPKRSSDREAVDYFFKTAAEFEDMIKNDELLEYDKIYNNWYGTPKEYVLNKLNAGVDVLFDVNYVGAKQIKEKLGDLAISIFISPPSLEILKERLVKRGEDDTDGINLRVKLAAEEMSDIKHYDFTIVNSNLEKTASEVLNIIKQEKKSRE
ncbi:MAG: guanylate kinase [Rickettsiaceae bacterium]|nr:guanylate kinase [Rickettsiaceae bacterium]